MTTKPPPPGQAARSIQRVEYGADDPRMSLAGGSSPHPPVPDLPGMEARSQETRAVLDRLQQVLEDAEHSLQDSDRAAELLQANKQLVLAALRSQAEAERYARVLHDVVRSAELDTLTGIPNRVALHTRFVRAAANSARHGNRMALLFVDLNDFKQINDTRGHAFGDEVLKLATRCLESSIRDTDTVSRYGGDEFLILLADIAEPSDAQVVAGKLIDTLGTPCRVGDEELRLAASIGISIYPDDGTELEALIRCADAAMYRAKRRGGGGYVLHGEAAQGSPRKTASERVRLARDPAADRRSRGDQERLIAQLRATNQQLIAAARAGEQMQDAAASVQHQQAMFMNVLAHQLRNPLAPIRTATELLTRVPTDELPKLQAIVERQVSHLTRVVGDVLEISRASTGKLRLESVVVDLSFILGESAESCRATMDRRLQRLIVSLPRKALVHGDPIRLSKIFCNLLNNASKYTQDGGEISLTAEKSREAVVVTVSDTGIGIDPESLASIFDPFVQDPRAKGFNGEGLGIGLTVVRELVDAHGGTVVAHSAGADLGSQFIVTLPLAEH